MFYGVSHFSENDVSFFINREHLIYLFSFFLACECRALACDLVIPCMLFITSGKAEVSAVCTQLSNRESMLCHALLAIIFGAVTCFLLVSGT